VNILLWQVSAHALHWHSIALQLIVGLGGIILGARIFVDSISNLSTALGFSALIMSLLIAPVATELPEKYNSITWTIRRQDTLALANVTGAMVFQSMIPVSIGLFLTDWKLGTTEMLNISFALLSSVLVLATMLIKKKLPSQVLLVGGLFTSLLGLCLLPPVTGRRKGGIPLLPAPGFPVVRYLYVRLVRINDSPQKIAWGWRWGPFWAYSPPSDWES